MLCVTHGLHTGRTVQLAHAIVFSLTAQDKGRVGSSTLVKRHVWQWVAAAKCRNTESMLVVDLQFHHCDCVVTSLPTHCVRRARGTGDDVIWRGRVALLYNPVFRERCPVALHFTRVRYHH